MNEKVLYTTSMILGALALVFLVANVLLIDGNRDLQQQVLDRQTKLNAGAPVAQLNQNLAQALAQSAVKNDDQQIRELLKTQGITINVGGKPENAASAKPAAGKNSKP
jgi:DNA-binding protein H-NS